MVIARGVSAISLQWQQLLFTGKVLSARFLCEDLRQKIL